MGIRKRSRESRRAIKQAQYGKDSSPFGLYYLYKLRGRDIISVSIVECILYNIFKRKNIILGIRRGGAKWFITIYSYEGAHNKLLMKVYNKVKDNAELAGIILGEMMDMDKDVS